MLDLFLTQYSGKILGPIAKLFGYLMNGIYYVWDHLFSVQNIAVCIITLTVIIYICLIPLTRRQQKFSRLNQVMQPEIKKIQEKYRGRKDTASQQAMQEETQAIYDKYGVSPMGSCLQLIIQIPILWALYRVIYNVPAYVPAIKEKFSAAVTAIMNTDGYTTKLTELLNTYPIRGLSVDFSVDATTTSNYIIDILYKLPQKGWSALKESFSSITDTLDSTYQSIEGFNTFLGVNISESPFNLMRDGAAAGMGLVVFVAVMIPILSALTQFINIKLTQSVSAATPGDQMAAQMKMMNFIMPIFSFILVFTLPVGVGVYWIAGAVIRTIIQLLINRHLSKMDFDEIIAKNKEKAEQKAKKRKERKGIYADQVRSSASLRTKSMTAKSSGGGNTSNTYIEGARPGSLASKANAVTDYNNKNTKK